MNEVIKAMLERRSIRKFKPELPKREDIETILETGLYAANGKGRQATLTVAITNPELRTRFVEANRKIGGWAEGFDPFYGAPVILLVLAEKDWGNAVYDGSLVMGNLMLARDASGSAVSGLTAPARSSNSRSSLRCLRNSALRASGSGSDTAPSAISKASFRRQRRGNPGGCSGSSETQRANCLRKSM